MFTEKNNEWLAEKQLDDGIVHDQVLHAEGNLSLSADEIAATLEYPKSVCLVIDGDLTVDGHLAVDDMHALVVTGCITCRSFSIGEGRLCAGELKVAEAATFSCWGSDMHHFEVDQMSAGLWCTPASELPNGLLKLDCEYTIETSDLDEEKLFSWIVDDSAAAVYAALKNGETIDDAWCLSHKELVKKPELRAHLGLGEG